MNHSEFGISNDRDFIGITGADVYKLKQAASRLGLRLTLLEKPGQEYRLKGGGTATVEKRSRRIKVSGFGSEGLTLFWKLVGVRH